MVRSLGADHVVDYTHEDFTRSSQRYDLIVDNVGTHSVLEYRRVMKPDGALVIIGSADKGPWIGMLTGTIQAMVLSPFMKQDAGLMFAQLNQPDLRLLAELLQSGKVRPVIDRRYGADEIREAIRYLEDGHARGKVVVTFP
jgi:NADPH:quinone reductase-like Zn-dependent oxidoreductase